MEYTMRAIPTLFRGVQYRSRLEARWASFFTFMGWPFDYEPMDLCGWAPDFLLRPPSGPLFVEIKPVVQWDTSIAEKTETAMRDARDPILICGLDIQYPGGVPLVGWVGRWKRTHWFWDDAIIVCSSIRSLTDWETDTCTNVNPEQVQDAWASACNGTQWIPNG